MVTFLPSLLQNDGKGVFLSVSKSLSFPPEAVGGCNQYFEQVSQCLREL